MVGAMSEPIAQTVALVDGPPFCLASIEVSGGGGDEDAKTALEGDGEFVTLEGHAYR